MKTLALSLATAGAAALFLASPASAQDLPPAAAQQTAHADEVQAEATISHDDWSAALAAAARSYREYPTLRNEFNLASAYEHAGDATLAILLYQDVAARADLAWGVTLYDYRRTGGPEHKSFYLADEAARRLTVLTGTPVASSAR